MTDRAREIAHKHIEACGWPNQPHSEMCHALREDIVTYGIKAIASKAPLYRIDGKTGEVTEALCADCGAKL